MRRGRKEGKRQRPEPEGDAGFQLLSFPLSLLGSVLVLPVFRRVWATQRKETCPLVSPLRLETHFRKKKKPQTSQVLPELIIQLRFNSLQRRRGLREAGAAALARGTLRSS